MGQASAPCKKVLEEPCRSPIGEFLLRIRFCSCKVVPLKSRKKLNQVYLTTQQTTHRETLAQNLLEEFRGVEFSDLASRTGQFSGPFTDYTYLVDMVTPTSVPILGPSASSLDPGICAKN